jgi:hypothetical protein
MAGHNAVAAMAGPGFPEDPRVQAIEAAELAGAESRYRLQLAREMYAAGRRDAQAEMAEAWRRVAAPVVHGISAAEMEERRWGPGGRAHFGDPRPGDFPGRPEPEPEAGL